MNTFWLSPLSPFLPGQSVQTYEKVRDRSAAVEYTGGWACMLKPKDRRRTAALSQSMSMRFLSIHAPSRLVLGAGTFPRVPSDQSPLFVAILLHDTFMR